MHDWSPEVVFAVSLPDLDVCSEQVGLKNKIIGKVSRGKGTTTAK